MIQFLEENYYMSLYNGIWLTKYGVGTVVGSLNSKENFDLHTYVHTYMYLSYTNGVYYVQVPQKDIVIRNIDIIGEKNMFVHIVCCSKFCTHVDTVF